MAKPQNCLFCPSPRILTCGGFSFLAILIAAMCLSSYVVADDVNQTKNIYQTATMPNTKKVNGQTINVDYGRSEYWDGNVAPTAVSNSNFFCRS